MSAADTFLHAMAVRGGIRLSWGYPVINAAAVAHTEVYRSASNNFAAATQIAIASGNYYIDPMNDEASYYYWIRLVSVHGTQGELVGPVLGTSRSAADWLADEVNSPGNESLLDGFFAAPIATITSNYAELRQEILDRVNGNSALAAAIAAVNSGLADALTVVNEEITSRIEGENAMIQRQNVLAAVNAENVAAITRVEEASIARDEAAVSRLDALDTLTASTAASVTAEATARANADSALAQTVEANRVAATNANAATMNYAIAQAGPSGALAQRINQVQVNTNNQVAQVQQTMQTQYNSLTNKLESVWGVKMNVNGRASGFAMINTGQQSEFRIETDSFYIGNGASNIKPFRVVGNTTYIENAVIQNLSLAGDKLQTGAITQIEMRSLATGTASHVAPGKELTGFDFYVPEYASGIVCMWNFLLTGWQYTDMGLYTSLPRIIIYRDYYRTNPTVIVQDMRASPGSVSGAFKDSPSPGWHQYHMFVQQGNGWTAGSNGGYFTFIVAKR